MSAIRQIARVAKDATHHIYNHILMHLIATQLQFYYNNSFSTTMQIPYDYNYNITLMSFFHPFIKI
jgi:hypothetical protein